MRYEDISLRFPSTAMGSCTSCTFFGVRKHLLGRTYYPVYPATTAATSKTLNRLKLKYHCPPLKKKKNHHIPHAIGCLCLSTPGELIICQYGVCPFKTMRTLGSGKKQKQITNHQILPNFWYWFRSSAPALSDFWFANVEAKPTSCDPWFPEVTIVLRMMVKIRVKLSRARHWFGCLGCGLID